jgi:hypothetical protein
VTVEFVIGAYYRLFQIEKSFRMSQHDLQARPVQHHRPDTIEVLLAIVLAVPSTVSASTQARTNLADPAYR